jgi:hypothetical protein
LEESFRIVTVGLKAGQAPEAVGRQLAALFKCSTRHVGALLVGEGVSVKRGLALSEAAKYMQALDQCGLVTAILPERKIMPILQVPKTFMRGIRAEPAPAFEFDSPREVMLGAALSLAGAVASFLLVFIAFRSAATMPRDLLFFANCAAILVFSVVGVGCAIRFFLWWRD